MKKYIKLIALSLALISLSSCGLLRDAGTVANDHETSTEAITEYPVPEGAVIPKRDPDAPLTVCIDAGHGYDDPGCTSDYLNGRWEKDITAEYAAELKAELESRGYRVVMLHTPERYVTADEIKAEADRLGLVYKKDKVTEDGRFGAYNRTIWTNVLHRATFIDVFVSLHVDSLPSDKSVKGTRTYYCSENVYKGASKRLCDSISTAIGDAVPGRKAQTYAKNLNDAYIVTKYSHMPSALIEIGFASNKDDAGHILDPEWRGKFVSAVADGIGAYWNK